MYKTAYLTDKGLKRKVNEDAFLVADACGLFVVADGMGGHERGEVASRMVVESFKQILCSEEDSTISYCDEHDEDETVPYFGDDDEDATVAYEDDFEKKSQLEDLLNRVIETSTNKIKTYAKEKVLSSQIGTTVVGLYKLKNEEEMALFHLGDSRAYRIRNEKIEKLTIDHSKYEKMKQSGKYSEEELSKVNRNSITKAIGNFNVMPLEINYVDLKKEDIFILCSDGVSDLTHAQEMLKIIEKNKGSLENAVSHIKKLVYERGAKDNLSIIIFRYGA
jgi:serine/threonine protein phosphatase PrpC